MTQADRYHISDLQKDQNLCRKICGAISDGAVFIYPTETIYGIGGLATITGTDKKVMASKNRDDTKELLLLSASEDNLLNQHELILPPAAIDLKNAFWPGKLTLILPTAYGTTFGVRLSDHPFMKLIEPWLDGPLYSTSANLSGEPYNPDPEFIFSTFSSRVDIIVDAGILPVSPPSTIAAVSKENEVTLLREGVVSAQELSSVLPNGLKS